MTEVEGINTLSIRGAENAGRPDHWEPLIRALANPWAPTNPDGMSVKYQLDVYIPLIKLA